MFAFNPPQYNNGAEYAAAAGRLFGAGLDQAGTSISDAIRQMHQLQFQTNVAQGTMQTAKSMGLVTDADLAHFNSLNPYQQIGAAQSVTPMVTAKNLAMLYGARAMTAEAKASAAGSKVTGIMPWTSTPASGGLGNAGASDSGDPGSSSN